MASRRVAVEYEVCVFRPGWRGLKDHALALWRRQTPVTLPFKIVISTEIAGEGHIDIEAVQVEFPGERA
jgi:hypothetical protein